MVFILKYKGKVRNTPFISQINDDDDYLYDRFSGKDLSKFESFNIDELFDLNSQQSNYSQSNIILPDKINKSGSHSNLDNIQVTNQAELDVLLDKIVREFSSGLPRDLKIDDGDLPKAKNFYDWSYNKDFVGENEPIYPFPKQMQIISTFYTEWCYNPKCTDLAYAREVPVDAKIEEILERHTFLEHGKCPKCGLTRIDIWNSREFKAKRYTDIVGIAGQRCVTGDTLVNTDKGSFRIDFFSKEGHKGDWEQLTNVNVLTRKGIQNACALFSSKEKEDILIITMSDGTVIKGTPEHPLIGSEGLFIKLVELNTGDFLRKYKYYTNEFELIKISDISTGKDYVYDFHVPYVNEFFTENGYISSNSGKTAGINRLNSYQSHRMFKLNRPQKVFGTEESVWFESSFTATTFAKAIDNFYDPLVYQFKNNPWFCEYHKMLDYYGQKHGEQLYKILGETSYYRHRNYQFYPQSPDPANMRGATRYLVDIDELSHLYAQSDNAKKLNPRELHTSLRNSLFTLRNAYNKLVAKGFYDIPPPVMCSITSPRSMNDFGMKLYNLAQDKESTTYAFHYNVYEMNPNVALDDPELAEIKRTDPEGFKRDYLAIPPSAHNAFIEDKNIVKAMVRDKHVNAIKLQPVYITGHARNIKAMSATYEERKDKKINKHSNKVMALDAGSRHNSFAIVVGHLEVGKHPYEPDLNTVTKVIDIIGEVMPKDDRIISFTDLYDNVIAPVISSFNVIFISADRWQSIKILQDASDEFDIPYAMYSCKYKDFINWKGSIYSGDFWIPMPEKIKLDEAFTLAADNYPLCFEEKPIAHSMVQMLTVENLMNKTVEKGQNFTDDIFRAMVLCNRWLSDDELREELLADNQPQADPNAFVGVYSSGSGNVTTLSGASINTSGIGTEGVGAMASLPGWGNR